MNQLQVQTQIKSIHIIMIDHYDSFTYNLVDCFRKLNILVTVLRPDVDIKQITSLLDSEKTSPVLVLSPGPGAPHEADLSNILVKNYYHKLPILGICLGHQIIAHALGGKITALSPPAHGKSVTLQHNQENLFKTLNTNIHVGRYHSLCVTDLPNDFIISAQYEAIIMSMAHSFLPIFGLQFHPESILTPDGDCILQNFIDLCQNHYEQKGKNYECAL